MVSPYFGLVGFFRISIFSRVPPAPSCLLRHPPLQCWCTPSPSHHIPAFFLVPLLPKSRPYSNCQFQPPRSIFRGVIPPVLLDLPVHHRASLGRYRLAQNQSTLIPTLFGLLPFPDLLSISLKAIAPWATSTVASLLQNFEGLYPPIHDIFGGFLWF